MNTNRRRQIADMDPMNERIQRWLYRGYKTLIQRQASDPGPRNHVFVAGMQRSGTNMLMKVLDWNRYGDVYHETDRRAFDTKYEMRDPEVIRALSNASQAPFLIIKSLCELDKLRWFLDNFTPAKIIWIYRQYADTINSATRSFANFSPQLKRLAKNKNSDAWRGRGMSDETQELLGRVATLDPDEASAAAMMWYYRNILFFEQSLDQDERVLLIRYKDFVFNPTAITDSICKFIGFPTYDPRWMTRFIHSTSVNKLEPPKLLPEVEEVCSALMARFESAKRV